METFYLKYSAKSDKEDSNYYKHNGIEAWDIIDKVMEYFGSDINGSEAFYVGVILKYLLRFPYKGQRKSDLKKIRCYAKRLNKLSKARK